MTNSESRRLRKRVSHVKRKARSELSLDDWNGAQFHESYPDLLSRLGNDNITRIDARKMTPEQFVGKIESANVPVILTGIMDTWPANRKWSIDKLSRKYRNQRFKCGEDDHGYSVKLKLKYFVEYMLTTVDDSPLYIFDSSFGERRKTKKLLLDYDVPSMFSDDLFSYADERRRPPYRWIVIGAARSGTGIHVDPLGTSAWNALLFGRKKWCFFPSKTPKSFLKPTRSEGGKHEDEAITWFTTVFERTMSPSWPKEWKPIEAIQRPGELVFVPSENASNIAGDQLNLCNSSSSDSSSSSSSSCSSDDNETDIEIDCCQESLPTAYSETRKRHFGSDGEGDCPPKIGRRS